MVSYKNQLRLYDELVSACPRFQRKGKTMPYTSANGYMFSLLNKDAELGIRFSKTVQEKYILEFNTSIYKSHGAIMKGYILLTEEMLNDKKLIIKLLNESFDYVMLLDQK